MWEITTGSRLHFGLFQPGRASPGERQFGGVGMMIARPGLRLRAEPAAEWSASGPLARRVLEFAHIYHAHQAADPLRFSVLSAPPEHSGFGTGTQLGLAVVKLITTAMKRPDLPVTMLGLAVHRGRRSSIGLHGFAQGGLLVDAGKRPPTENFISLFAPLIARARVPEAWRVVLAIPYGDQGWHGRREQQAFDLLGMAALDPAMTDRLCRLTLLGMLPAVIEKDVDAFGEALHEYNALAGSMFAEAQGGTYAGPQVAAVVEFLRGLGVKGVGQSSWGPTVFAIVGDEDRASFLAERLKRQMPLKEDEVIVTVPLNEGARVVDLVTGQPY
jgi:beta-RFAP synthase